MVSAFNTILYHDAEADLFHESAVKSTSRFIYGPLCLQLHAQLTPLLRAVDAAVSGHQELLLRSSTVSPTAAAAVGTSPDSAAASPTQKQQQQPTSGQDDSEGGSWASFGSRVHPPAVQQREQQESGSSPQTDSGWWHSDTSGEPSASLGSLGAATPQSAAAAPPATNLTPEGQSTPAAPDAGTPVTPASGAPATGASSVASAPGHSLAAPLGSTPREPSPAGTSPVGNVLREVRDTASLLRTTHDISSPRTASGPASAAGSPTACTPAAHPTALSPLSEDPFAFTPATMATLLTDEKATTPAKTIETSTAAAAATSTPGSSPGWGEDAPKPCPPDSAVVAYLAARTAATTPTEGVLRHMQLSVVAASLRICSLAALASGALVEEQRWRARALTAEEQLRVLQGAPPGALLVDAAQGPATAAANATADELWEMVGGEAQGSARSSSGGWSSAASGMEQGKRVAQAAGDGEAGQDVGGDGGASSDGEQGGPELQHVLWEEAKAEEAARAREAETAEAEAVAALEAQQQQGQENGGQGQSEEVEEQGHGVAAPQPADEDVIVVSFEGVEVDAEAGVGVEECVLEQADAVGGVLSQLVRDVEAGAADSGEQQGEGVGGGGETGGAGGEEAPLLYGFMEHLRSPPRWVLVLKVAQLCDMALLAPS